MTDIEDLELTIIALQVYPIEPNIIKDMLKKLRNINEQITKVSRVELPVMPNEVLAGGLTKELFKILQWVYDQEEIELLETGWYCKGDELSTQEVLVKYFASQREA